MRKLQKHPPLTDYSAAVARAIAWLGDRYLLARPVNVAPAAARRNEAEEANIKAIFTLEEEEA